MQIWQCPWQWYLFQVNRNLQAGSREEQKEHWTAASSLGVTVNQLWHCTRVCQHGQGLGPTPGSLVQAEATSHSPASESMVRWSGWGRIHCWHRRLQTKLWEPLVSVLLSIPIRCSVFCILTLVVPQPGSTWQRTTPPTPPGGLPSLSELLQSTGPTVPHSTGALLSKLNFTSNSNSKQYDPGFTFWRNKESVFPLVKYYRQTQHFPLSLLWPNMWLSSTFPYVTKLLNHTAPNTISKS